MHLYVQAQEQTQEVVDDEAPKEISGREKSSDVLVRTKFQTHSEHTIESSTATTRRRNKREWKGIGREGNEKFPLRNVLTDILHGEEKRSQKSNEVLHPPSKQQNGRKRDRDDEPQQTKVCRTTYYPYVVDRVDGKLATLCFHIYNFSLPISLFCSFMARLCSHIVYALCLSIRLYFS